MFFLFFLLFTPVVAFKPSDFLPITESYVDSISLFPRNVSFYSISSRTVICEFADYERDCWQIFTVSLFDSFFVSPSCPGTPLCPTRRLLSMGSGSATKYLCFPVVVVSSSYCNYTRIRNNDYNLFLNYSANHPLAHIVFSPVTDLVQITLSSQVLYSTPYLVPAEDIAVSSVDYYSGYSAPIFRVPNPPFFFRHILPPFDSHELRNSQAFKDWLYSIIKIYPSTCSPLYYSSQSLSYCVFNDEMLLINYTSSVYTRTLTVNSYSFSIKDYMLTSLSHFWMFVKVEVISIVSNTFRNITTDLYQALDVVFHFVMYLLSYMYSIFTTYLVKWFRLLPPEYVLLIVITSGLYLFLVYKLNNYVIPIYLFVSPLLLFYASFPTTLDSEILSHGNPVNGYIPPTPTLPTLAPTTTVTTTTTSTTSTTTTTATCPPITCPTVSTTTITAVTCAPNMTTVVASSILSAYYPLPSSAYAIQIVYWHCPFLLQAPDWYIYCQVQFTARSFCVYDYCFGGMYFDKYNPLNNYYVNGTDYYIGGTNVIVRFPVTIRDIECNLNNCADSWYTSTNPQAYVDRGFFAAIFANFLILLRHIKMMFPHYNIFVIAYQIDCAPDTFYPCMRHGWSSSFGVQIESNGISTSATSDLTSPVPWTVFPFSPVIGYHPVLTPYVRCIPSTTPELVFYVYHTTQQQLSCGSLNYLYEWFVGTPGFVPLGNYTYAIVEIPIRTYPQYILHTGINRIIPILQDAALSNFYSEFI